MKVEQTPFTKVAMLIRKPVAEVFEAFVDPAITSKFWFTKGSGRLETGKLRAQECTGNFDPEQLRRISWF
jgi:uncharacterized protein YndB with AHSA1/START domain